MDFRFGLCFLCLLACTPEAKAPTAASANDSSGPTEPQAVSNQSVVSNSSSLPGSEAARDTEGEEGLPGKPPLDAAEMDRLRLPEVVVENMGLHIGGESNEPDAKQPFLTALEAQFKAFRLCYRFVTKPGQGGVFGVDLLVPRDGKGAHVRDVRTRMAGEEFKGCMVAAFGETEFEPPRRPVVLSYSLRFSINPPGSG